eukprot:Nk52_evm6s271 gene=Nk52_evmTU6s271
MSDSVKDSSSSTNEGSIGVKRTFSAVEEQKSFDENSLDANGSYFAPVINRSARIKKILAENYTNQSPTSKAVIQKEEGAGEDGGNKGFVRKNIEQLTPQIKGDKNQNTGGTSKSFTEVIDLSSRSPSRNSHSPVSEVARPKGSPKETLKRESEPAKSIYQKLMNANKKQRVAKPQPSRHRIGEFCCQGQFTLSGKFLLKPGTAVNFEVSSTEPLFARCLKGKRGKTDTNVRVLRSDGMTVGRLHADIACWMNALICSGLFEFEASCVVSTEGLATFMDPFFLQVTVYFKESLWMSGSEPFSDNSLKYPLLKLFEMCNVKPITENGMNIGALIKRNLQEFDIMIGKITEIREDEYDDEMGKVDVEKELVGFYESANQDKNLTPVNPSPSFKSELHQYQKQGLGWMLSREISEISSEKSEQVHPMWLGYLTGGLMLYFQPYAGKLSCSFPRYTEDVKGGILADEMGLGKTVETLALIESNRPTENYVWGPYADHLTACKATLIILPMSLLSQWEDEILAHTSFESRNVLLFYGSGRSNTCLSNKDIVITSYGVVSSEFNKEMSSELFNQHWFRIVLDEAHMIKSKAALVNRACRALSSEARWALTGTPIQNKLDDLYSLISFLKVEPWSTYNFWKMNLLDLYAAKDPRWILNLRSVLNPLLLRRTKASTNLQGGKILELPPIVYNVAKLCFSAPEKDFYDMLFTKSKMRFSEYAAKGTIMFNYASVFELLLRLRQCCDHPFLITNSYDPKSDKPLALSGIPELLDKFKSQIENWDAEGVEGNSMGGKTDLLSQAKTRTEAQSRANRIMEILSTANDQECIVCFDPLVLSECAITPCLHVSCYKCMVAFIENSNECPTCRGKVEVKDIVQFSINTKEEASDSGGRESAFTALENVNEDSTLQEQMDAIKTIPKKPGIQLGKDTWKSSSKLLYLVELVQNLRKQKQEGVINNDKVVIFSQWTSMLDLIEEALKRNDLGFVRLDGSMTQSQRQVVLREFSTTDTQIFLISLRAGGVGLNLTSASHVVVVDPWWNPAAEEQAINRVHRIGQKEPVTVTHIIIEDSVEVKILKMQEKKRLLVQGAMTLSERNRDEVVNDLIDLFS